MRDAFADEIEKLAAADSRLVLLSGDIGNRMFDRFKARFPDRFYNAGVAEANMATVAAGLALAGLRPVTYTITAFNTLRCLEQIRVDICCQNLPVTIVGVGGGLSYASLNPTHHALEDVGCLRMLPNLTVLCPADAHEVRAAMREVARSPGPTYIRLGKKGEPVVHASTPGSLVGQSFVIREGRDVCFLCAGTLLPATLAAASVLASRSISAEVVSCPSVKPLDETRLARVFADFPLIVTIEEHGRAGGFGSAVAEWFTDQVPRSAARILRIGTADVFLPIAGEQDHARSFFGLTAEGIANQAEAALGERAAIF
jgi:transketolase